LILIDQEPIHFVVASFYGTHVMNVANWRGAYCLFPRTTLEEGKIYLFSMTRRLELQAFDKYVGRGFTLVGDRRVEEQFEELTAVRRVGDAFSRKLGFPDVQVDGRDPEDGRRTLEEFSFKFDGSRMRKLYGVPVGRAESVDGSSDDSREECLGCEETLDKCRCEAC
jgi:hypothetical protein